MIKHTLRNWNHRESQWSMSLHVQVTKSMVKNERTKGASTTQLQGLREYHNTNSHHRTGLQHNTDLLLTQYKDFPLQPTVALHSNITAYICRAQSSDHHNVENDYIVSVFHWGHNKRNETQIQKAIANSAWHILKPWTLWSPTHFCVTNWECTERREPQAWSSKSDPKIEIKSS